MDLIMAMGTGLKFRSTRMLFILAWSKLTLLEILVEFHLEKCHGILNHKCWGK